SPQFLIIYPYGEATEVKLVDTPNIKGVGGSAVVKNDEKATFIDLSLHNVPPLHTLGNYNCLVAWAMLDDGSAFNLGQLNIHKDGAGLRAATHLKSFRLAVTAEADPNVRPMSGFFVAEMTSRVPKRMLSDIKLDPIGFNASAAEYFKNLARNGRLDFQNGMIVYPPYRTVNLDFRGTTDAPDATGEAHITNRGPLTQVNVEFKDLPQLEPGLNGYVVWAVFSDGQHFRLGDIPGWQRDHARLDATFPFNRFGIMVTAETKLDTVQPSSRYILVMDNIDKDGVHDSVVFLPPKAIACKSGKEIKLEADCPTGISGMSLRGEGEINPDSPSGPGNHIVDYQWDIDGADKFDIKGADLRTHLGYGKHEVALKVIDAFGLESTDRVTVNVVDTTPPTIQGLPDVVKVEAQSPSGTAVRLPQPTVKDAGDPAPLLSISTPQVFPIGETKVTYTAVDKSGNRSQALVTVQVVDTTAPVIAGVPKTPIVAEAKSHDGTPIAVPMPTVTDNGDAHPQLTIDSPKVFPLGETVVKYIATDSSGNRSEADMTVRLVDTTPPVISGLPTSPIVVECTGGSSASVALPRPTITDLVDTAPALAMDIMSARNNTIVSTTSVPALGLGDNTIEYTARDASGNVANANVVIKVVDRAAPVFVNLPTEPIVVEATNAKANAVQLPAFVANDVCTGPVSVISNAPTTFPMGDTNVTLAAKDSSNNVASAMVTVRVIDRTPPTITGLPSGPIVVEATGPRGTAVALPQQIRAVDSVDPNPKLSVNAPPVFPLGDTVLTYTATDFSGNSAQQNLTVRVIDRTPPVISGIPSSPIALEATDPAGMPIKLPQVIATDTVDEHPTLSSDAPANLPVGDTTVTYVATDGSGNKSTAKLIFKVTYTPPPQIAIANPVADSTLIEEQLNVNIKVSSQAATTTKLLINGKELSEKFALPAGGGSIAATVTIKDGENI